MSEKTDHGAVLTDALLEVITEVEPGGELAEDQVAVVQTVFRSIPAGARGKAQGLALKAVVEAGGAVHLPALIDAMTSAPAPAQRASKPKADPRVALTIQAAGILVAFADVTADEELGADVAAAAKDWFQNGCPDEHKEAILRAAANAVKGAGRRSGGTASGGPRASFKETLSDIIARGGVEAPTELTYGKEGDGGTATLLETGEIQVGEAIYANPSAAAKAINEAEGRGQVNGWTFFKVGGATLASLRVG